MSPAALPKTNFAHLQEHDKQLWRLGMQAETYFLDDPNTSLLKLRQLAELLAQLVATKVGLYDSPDEVQYDLLRRLQDQGKLPRDISQLFHKVRQVGNDANHAMRGDHGMALDALKVTWQLGVWFHREFKNPQFKSGPFIPPSRPQDESKELNAVNRMKSEPDEYQASHHKTSQELHLTETPINEQKNDNVFCEQMAVKAEQAKAELEKRLAAQLPVVSQPREYVTPSVSRKRKMLNATEPNEIWRHMSATTKNLGARSISPRDVRSDGNLTSPPSYGVYELPQSAAGTRRYRLGNYPVRMHELEREYGSCKLVFLFLHRSDAVAMASGLNGAN